MSKGVVTRAEQGGPISIRNLERLAPILGSTYEDLLRIPKIGGRITIEDESTTALITRSSQASILVQLIADAIQILAKLKDTLETTGYTDGSITIYVLATRDDAAYLTAHADRLISEAHDRWLFLTHNKDDSTLPSPLTQRLGHRQALIACLAISQITQILFLSTKPPLLWRKGDKPPSPPVPRV